MSLIKITQNKTKDENQRNVLFPLDNRHFITVLDCFLISIYNLKGKEKKDKHWKFSNQNVYPA